MLKIIKIAAVTFLVMGLAAGSAVSKGTSKDASKSAPEGVRFPSPEGLAMAGYQGWFNTPGDGADQGWRHYQRGGRFEPGSCVIDMCPDVSEYEKTYETPFRLADGTVARVFSSADASTTDLHFRWMRDYGIDGVYMQRFVVSLRTQKSVDNTDKILFNALQAAEKYDRAICLMYDLSSMKPEETAVVIKDWERLVGKGLVSQKNNHYLHCNGRPLVALWGVGFSDDKRAYSLADCEKLIDYFRGQGCSVLLGLPARWRTLRVDAVKDPALHALILKADVVQPWLVGRFNNDNYARFQPELVQDAEWCRAHDKIYMPVIWPGFSWYNLHNGVDVTSDAVPRLGGEFFWKQVDGALQAGAKCFYYAMFDEMNEGTALFKCTDDVPVGRSPFVTMHGLPSDHYLWLAGQAARMMRGEIPLTDKIPPRN